MSCKGLNTVWIPRPFTTLIGGKGLPPYQLCPAAKGFYVGRHPYADRRSVQPVNADALFGGKGLPPYQPCPAAKGCRPTFAR